MSRTKRMSARARAAAQVVLCALLASIATEPAAGEQFTVAGPLDHGYEYDIVVAGRRVGSYVVALQTARDGAEPTYTLRGRFVIGAGGVFGKRPIYEAVDTVSYDRAGLRTYRIDEDDNGVKTTVSGERSADGRRIAVTIGAAAAATRKEIDTAAFDLTLFGLRFARPCGAAQVGNRSSLRLLVPRSGTPVTVHSTVREFGPRQLGAQTLAVCTIVTTGADGKPIKESWVRPDGVMVYESSPEYTLTLKREGTAALFDGS
ncbi:MAG: hypothetical protein ACK5TK_04940 [Betaproteobacteria bacterium]